MTKIKDIYDFLCNIAPLELQCSFDNAGFQTGRGDREVKKALLSLDVTDWVIDEAKEKQAELIVSHHPLLFTPLKKFTDESRDGEKLLRLAENGIAVISMHTNLDIAWGGVNDALAQRLELVDPGPLCENGLGRVGEYPESVALADYVRFVCHALGCNGLRYADAGKPVRRVAVGGGACGEFEEDAIRAGCDTFVTADLSYHQFLDAAGKGINLIDAGHFPTEDPVCEKVITYLTDRFPELAVSKSASHREVIQYYVEGE